MFKLPFHPTVTLILTHIDRFYTRNKSQISVIAIVRNIPNRNLNCGFCCISWTFSGFKCWLKDGLFLWKALWGKGSSCRSFTLALYWMVKTFKSNNTLRYSFSFPISVSIQAIKNTLLAKNKTLKCQFWFTSRWHHQPVHTNCLTSVQGRQRQVRWLCCFCPGV